MEYLSKVSDKVICEVCNNPAIYPIACNNCMLFRCKDCESNTCCKDLIQDNIDGNGKVSELLGSLKVKCLCRKVGLRKDMHHHLINPKCIKKPCPLDCGIEINFEMDKIHYFSCVNYRKILRDEMEMRDEYIVPLIKIEHFLKSPIIVDLNNPKLVIQDVPVRFKVIYNLSKSRTSSGIYEYFEYDNVYAGHKLINKSKENFMIPFNIGNYNKSFAEILIQQYLYYEKTIKIDLDVEIKNKEYYNSDDVKFKIYFDCWLD